MNKIQMARARMLLGQIFFGTILLSTPLKASTLNATAWTDMTQIGYNPEFFDVLDVEEIAFVLAHEVGHIALSHGLRRGHRDPDRWNRAADYFINLWLVKAGFKMPQWKPHMPGYAERDSDNFGLLDEKYAGMSTEQIYEVLDKEDRKKGKGQGDGQGPGKPGKGQGPAKDGLHGDVMTPAGGLSADERAKVEQSIRQRVAQASMQARLAGQVKGDMARYIDELLDPKTPWEDLLRDQMTRLTRDDETWNRPNRRFTDIYLPTQFGVKLGEIVSIGDTSGSIGNDELCKQASEVNYICDVLQPERLRLVWADDGVTSEQTFEQGEPFDPKPVGGGGTDMRKPLKHVEEYNPTVVILFTDGHTPWPDEAPPYPLIVCCTTNVEVPDYAEVVRI